MMKQCPDCYAWMGKLRRQHIKKTCLITRRNEMPRLGSTYPCLICLKAFATKEAITTHYQEHTTQELKYIGLKKDLLEMAALSDQSMMVKSVPDGWLTKI